MSTGQKNGVNWTDEGLIEVLLNHRFALCESNGVMDSRRLDAYVSEASEIRQYTPRLLRMIRTGRVNAGMTDERIVDLFAPSGLLAWFLGTIARELALWMVRKIRQLIWK